ncbi:MAG TPA: hypothetical protein HPP83_11805 [Candidatus Hydrogenedentes bacterium]|nr:hypothetical protein [Candidatus Hydrogenedentota bacterium]
MLVFCVVLTLCGCPNVPVAGLIGMDVYLAGTLVVTGEVVDGTSGEPVEGAIVTYVDTGFVGQPAVPPVEEQIGGSNSRGRISIRHYYGFGAYITFEDILTGGPVKTFDLVVSKEGYESQEFHFVGSTCTSTESVNVRGLYGAIYIDFNTIRLEPVSEISSLLETGRKAVAQSLLPQMVLP